ncbi:chromate transporter [Gottfriedia sp. NPDC056225]|uniref:chromate transporter n=1 Tax=Gottfriedia sp. NPDC056225 TaxID=3345751 RepID=UPI00155902DB|nr:chromate transporter [Arthrobacter citreus]
MIFWKIFLAFFLPGIFGYGGGPASIPLIENEVVDKYGWMSSVDFSNVLALANALPGPIATKLAGYIGYAQGGAFGAFVGLFASIAPSLILMIALLSILMKYKNSPKVKKMTSFVKPLIAVLLGIMAFDFFNDSYNGVGVTQTIIISVLALLFLERWKIHPAYVIGGALVYGAIFLA